jgi:hypothetical protein
MYGMVCIEEDLKRLAHQEIRFLDIFSLHVVQNIRNTRPLIIIPN